MLAFILINILQCMLGLIVATKICSSVVSDYDISGLVFCQIYFQKNQQIEPPLVNPPLTIVNTQTSRYLPIYFWTRFAFSEKSQDVIKFCVLFHLTSPQLVKINSILLFFVLFWRQFFIFKFIFIFYIS